MIEINQERSETSEYSLYFPTCIERRQKVRICTQFPVSVRGKDENGNVFRVDGVLDNINASGLYLRVPRKIELGTKLLIVIRFSTKPHNREGEALVAVRGIVLRQQYHEDSLGLAVAAIKFKFIYQIKGRAFITQ